VISWSEMGGRVFCLLLGWTAGCATGATGGGDGGGTHCAAGEYLCGQQCWPACGVGEVFDYVRCTCGPGGGDADTDADADSDSDADADTDADADADSDTDPACDDGGYFCRLVEPQCGCAGGQKCVVIDADTRGCTGVGANDEGDACGAGGDDDCEVGLMCVSGPEGDDICRRFCDTDRDCTGGDGSLCTGSVGDAGGAFPDVATCSVDCNPLTSSGCRTGTSCNIFVTVAGGDTYLTDCDEHENAAGTQDVACDPDAGPYCARGYACIDAGDGAGNLCRAWCDDPGGIGACAGGRTCNGFDPAARIGATEYGVCL
jgi:hypothetical protein